MQSAPSILVYFVTALLAAIGCALAVYAGGYTPFLVALVALSTIVATGLNILVGLSGQISIGHVGFYAIGAYVFGILSPDLGVWLALPVAAVGSGLVGALLAIPALRVSGPYLAMMTIAFAFVVEHAIIEGEHVTGGQNGLMNILQPSLPSGLGGETAVALIAVLTAAATIAGYHMLARSPLGKAIVAVRDSEIAAQAIGANPVVLKTLAFAMSAAITGLAGGLFASLMTFVAPSSFPFSQSILFLFAVIVGGAGYTFGPFIGSLVVVLIPELISWMAEYRLLFFGVLLLVVLWLAPEGILGGIARLMRNVPGDPPVEDRALIARFLTRDTGAALNIEGLSIAFGGVQAAHNVGFAVSSSGITALIGPNGAGKTTVLNMISGFYSPDSGHIRLDDEDLAGKPAYRVARSGIARTYQTTQLFGSLSVIDNIRAALRNRSHAGEVGTPPLSEEQIASALLAFVGYKAGTGVAASDLPHVDRRLVEIARALALRPRVLLLDEPAAGLMQADKLALGTVLKKIADTGITVVLVEHDMGLVMSISDHVVVLDAGQTIADGTPEEVRNNPVVRQAYLGNGGATLHQRSGSSRPEPNIVLAVRSMSASYGAVPVLHEVSLSVAKGEMVALLGANGAGKSTIMKCLTGLLRPVSGEILLNGHAIHDQPPHAIAASRLALVPEGRRVFPELSVRDNLLLGSFLRSDDDVEKDLHMVLDLFPRLMERLEQRAGLLSGGEQQMLAIGRALMAKPEILLLDEPSLGLAPAIIDELFRIISNLRDAGTTILLVDQMATHALATSDRAYLIESGRIIRDGKASELRNDGSVEDAYLGQKAERVQV